MSGLGTVSARSGWGWVFVGGVTAALLATFPALGSTVAGGLWWLVAAGAGRLWGAAWWLVVALAVLLLAAGVGVGVRMWLRRNW